jgi:adenine-specific DNA-methyltransferase
VVAGKPTYALAHPDTHTRPTRAAREGELSQPAAVFVRDVGIAKQHGVHYTPGSLADFMAERIVIALGAPATAPSVLDPACGDGELLDAIARLWPTAHLTGVDRDNHALVAASQRLSAADANNFRPLHADFLDINPLADSSAQRLPADSFDAIISNPPYVRTQVLGAGKAQELAERFGLSGRVDLYQVFAHAMTPCLRPGGVLGLLCSNRFLTTLAGMALREFLNEEYELVEIFDLGDTKMFAAAVLPAIVIARRKNGSKAAKPCSYVRVYETSANGAVAPHVDSIVVALADDAGGEVEVDGRVYEIERGLLKIGETSKDPWTLTHDDRAAWLDQIEARTAKTFADVTNIRVGIKTTADSVFIRRKWDDLPADQRPESELIRPLITHHVADRWSPQDGSKQARTALYPHNVKANGKRGNVDLDEFPNAKRYLEANRERLERRTYVIKAGREWFEVWVAHQPADWPKRKIVFPDISEVPKFFLDESGAIVNGDCYWMAFEDDTDPKLLSLMLAVANSTFAVAFYDAVCGNRLYAGRRRFITQYVNRFPIPVVDEAFLSEIHALVEKVTQTPAAANERDKLEHKLDEMIWAAFGLLVGQTCI